MVQTADCVVEYNTYVGYVASGSCYGAHVIMIIVIISSNTPSSSSILQYGVCV